jgi:hypothetical protein
MSFDEAAIDQAAVSCREGPTRSPRRRRLRLPFPIILPVTPLLVLISPLLVLALIVTLVLPRPLGISPVHALLASIRFLIASSGTRIRVSSPDASFYLHII